MYPMQPKSQTESPSHPGRSFKSRADLTLMLLMFCSSFILLNRLILEVCFEA